MILNKFPTCTLPWNTEGNGARRTYAKEGICGTCGKQMAVKGRLRCQSCIDHEWDDADESEESVEKNRKRTPARKYLFKYNGKDYTIRQLALEADINEGTFRKKIRDGVPLEQAIEECIENRNRRIQNGCTKVC